MKLIARVIWIVFTMLVGIGAYWLYKQGNDIGAILLAITTTGVIIGVEDFTQDLEDGKKNRET